MCKTTDTTFFRYFIFYDIFFNTLHTSKQQTKTASILWRRKRRRRRRIAKGKRRLLAPKHGKLIPTHLRTCVCVFVREFGKHRESKLQLLYYICTTKQQRMIGVSVVEANDARFLFCISFIVLFLARLCVCIMPNKC